MSITHFLILPQNSFEGKDVDFVCLIKEGGVSRNSAAASKVIVSMIREYCGRYRRTAKIQCWKRGTLTKMQH